MAHGGAAGSPDKWSLCGRAVQSATACSSAEHGKYQRGAARREAVILRVDQEAQDIFQIGGKIERSPLTA